MVKAGTDLLNSRSRGELKRLPDSGIGTSSFSTSTFMSYFSVNPTFAWMAVSPSSFPKESAHAGVTISDNVPSSTNCTKEMDKRIYVTCPTATIEKNT